MTGPTEAQITEGAAELRAYVGAREDRDVEFSKEKWAEAHALVSTYLGTDLAAAPEQIVSQAILEVGAKLWARRTSPNGSAQIGPLGEAATPVLAPVDPMITVYPILRRYRTEGPFA